jgi:methylmalonyl-CoA mutase, C-terminal domain
MEVVYTGIRQTPQMIAEVALQEDVDVIGLSSLSGAHMSLFTRVVEELKKRDLDDLLLIAGGIIQDEDQEDLRGIGVQAVFGPGSSTQDMAEFIRANVRKSMGAGA